MIEGDVIDNGVIVAENDNLMRGVIRSVLLRAGQSVFPVANGFEAVAVARQFVARLVLLDVAMPHLNGLLACEAIRALPGYGRVPIVILTGYDNERIRQAARRFAVADFLTKPFRPDELLARLAPHIDLPPGLIPPPSGAAQGGEVPRVQVWPSQTDPGAMRARSGPESPAFVWTPAPDVQPGLLEPLALADGRRMMRIFRAADRGA